MVKKEDEVLLKVRAKRFGWKDFVLNLVSTLIMIGAFIATIIYFKSENIGDWVIAIVVITIPSIIFINRLFKEISYPRDFIQITKDKHLIYRSTPMLVTGFKIRKNDLPLVEIRRYGMSKIPRKLSLDLRKYKNKGMILIYSREGKEFFLGEYIEDAKLAEVCQVISNIYPKAKLVGDKTYLKNIKVNEKKLKKVKIEQEEEEPEGVFFRNR
ncbi:MAG: hypothetical protein ACTSWZ_04280 [Candidatus Heimdallarchaeaceae archaeon]